MNRDFLEAAYKLETATSLEKSWQVFVNTMLIHGIDRMIYIMRDDGAVANWFVLSNLPDNWPKQETSNRDFREPFVTYCCATYQPTKLGVEFVEQHDRYIDDYTRKYVAEMTRFSWTAGLGIPCGLVGSGQHGGFILGNDMSRHDFERSVMALADQIQTFCLIAHRKIDDWRRITNPTARRRSLSAREYQVLDLMSTGMRPKAIAAQLGLSEASIRLYVKNARLKLGAATKEEAMIRFVKEIQQKVLG